MSNGFPYLHIFNRMTNWFVKAKAGLQGIFTWIGDFFSMFSPNIDLRSMVFHRVMALGNPCKEK